MKILAKTKDLSHEEWLKYRTQGIGGSDVSILAGINPFKSVHQLWLEKTGQVELEEGDTEYTHFGTLLEPIVRKEFTARTGIKVRQKHMILQSEEWLSLKQRQLPHLSRISGKKEYQLLISCRFSIIWQSQERERLILRQLWVAITFTFI